MRFKITYDIVTPESARKADYAYGGFLTKNLSMPKSRYIPKTPARFPLRKMIEIMFDHQAGVHPFECDHDPVSLSNPPRWITAFKTEPSGEDGFTSTELSVQLEGVTPSTAIRIARLFGVKVETN